ncbi:MAG TPA: PTS fructose transporter subunit IIA [Burkholderiaceae bacterium]|nr:PTS fructose transporter subunit IIA [Burkholderiaceae bacterium]
MAGLLIIAHAPLASSLKAVAEHAFPDCTRTLQALDVGQDTSPDEIERQARALLQRLEQPEALILTDVFGATPCNVAQRLADGQLVKVVTGINVPMLWRALCYAAEPLDAVVARALAGAAQGVMQVAVSKPQNQANAPGAHDQASHYDQQ